MKQHNTDRKKLSFKSYLLIIFISFTAVLLTTLWLFQTVFLESFYKSVKTAQVKHSAMSIVSHIESNDLYSVIRDIEEKNSMNVSIYDSSQSILIPLYAKENFDGQKVIMSMSNVFSFYNEAKQNGGETTVSSKSDYFSKRDKGIFEKPKLSTDNEIEKDLIQPPNEIKNSEYLAYAYIKNTDNAEYFILVESMITPVESVVETLRLQLIIMTVLLVIISIIVAFITALRISKPIADINEKSKQLARENYDVSFSGGTFKEISELSDTLNTATTELKKVDSLRRELIANISHDLRTPLTMITGYAEIMRDLPNENNPENAQIIIDESTHLTNLVTDLLDISKYESNTQKLEKTVFCLTDCIREIFIRYSQLVKNENYKFIFENDEDVCVYADKLRITQVLYNLINNAINYAGVDKEIIVKQTVSNNKVRVDIIDHGVGIEQEKLKYIWDRYYKVDKEHKQAVVGSGLGLSIVKNILDLHNAEYGVNSKEGVGSDFYFILDVEKTVDDND